MTAELVSSPGFAPKLRRDLRASNGPTASIVLVTDPNSGRQLRLHEVEWRLAQQMDGTKGLHDLFAIARKYHPACTLFQIAHFLVTLANAGMLDELPERDDNEFVDSTSVDPDGSSWVVAAVSSSSDSYLPEKEVEIGEIDTDGAGVVLKFRRPGLDSTHTDRMAALEDHPPPDESEESTQGGASESATYVDPSRVEVQPIAPNNSELALAPYVPTLQNEDATPLPPLENPPAVIEPQAELVPQPPAPEAPVPASENKGLGPAGAQAEAEAEVEEKPPWHARPIVRRMRLPGGLVAVAAVAALIPYPRYVTAECAVLPSARAETRAQVDGIIAEIRVDEGQQVKAGDVLAELDSRDIDAALQQARADIQSLTAKLEKMKNGSRPEEIAKAAAVVKAREHDLAFARIEAERKQRLFAQGVGSAEQRDNAKRDYEVMRSSLAQAVAELKLMRAGFRDEEIRVAEAELRGAEAQLAYLEKKKERLRIVSPIDGQITTPKFREKIHARVAAGDTVCEVANTLQVRAEIYVPEQEVDLVEVGQPTVIKVHSLPLHPFSGEVVFIAPAVEKDGEKRFVRTVTVLENRDGLLHEGMTGYGEINTGRSTVLRLALRRLIRWVRVRFLI